MAQTTRQSNLLVEQNWTKIYQTFTNADFTSYDFETLRNTMINYLQTFYPDTFNDFTESSEYIALIDMIAFLGQSLAFRTDLNARENFIDTAQRRDSILKLARMLSYNPSRTNSASGLLKINSISTTETVYDSNGNNLSNAVVNWNDLTNENWQEQFTAILNASLIASQAVGNPGNSQLINSIQTDEYAINLNPQTLPISSFTVNIQTVPTRFEAVSATSVGESYIYEADPTTVGKFNVLYRNDNNSNASNNTGFFLYFKQGTLQATNFNITNAIPNNYVPVATNNINNTDAWLYSLDVNNNPQTQWTQVPAIAGINVAYNQLSNKNLYQINTQNNDQVQLVFGDGNFANIPQGSFRFYFRTSNGQTYNIAPDDMGFVSIALSYISIKNTVETLTFTASLNYTVTNATAAQSLTSIKTYAPQQYYTQNRMITGEDYNIFPLTTYTSIQKVKAINRISSGASLYIDTLDTSGSFSTTNIFADDGVLSANSNVAVSTFSFLNTSDIYTAIYNDIVPAISSVGMRNYYYANYPSFTPPYANIAFVQTGNTTSTSWGTFTYANANLSIGANASANLQYISTGASLAFTVNSSVIYGSVSSVASNTYAYFGTTVPTGAVLESIMPPLMNDLSANLVSTLSQQIASYSNFGLTYDEINQTWINISPADISTSTNWLVKCLYNAGLYTVQYRTLEYSFASAAETNFYFDPSAKIYDPATGSTVNDSIKVLRINSYPGNSSPIGQDLTWNVYGVITAPDGYVDQTQVLVTIPDTQVSGTPDDPALFTQIVGNSASRSNIYFQYKHNSLTRNRIDPIPVNIIDMYVLTSQYATDYINWLGDLTGTVIEPTLPTTADLQLSYSNLSNYKAISDGLVFSPAQFKPLFGAKATADLQARFKVVKNPSVNISDNEIKSQVISAVNTYFDINNWDFGETFYFTELAAYLHTALAPNISSILIVPASNTLVFGNYFQINAEPWEIITSAATVNDVDIISAVTAASLNLGNNLIGTY